MTNLDRRDFLLTAGGAMTAVAIMPEGLLGAVFQPEQAVRCAIVGTGSQGRSILTELAAMPAARVVAVCDADEGRLGGGRRRAPEAEAFTSHEQLLDTVKDLDAVIIATPTHTHRQIVEDAIGAGKHVYCEAPIAASVEDARAIARAAAGAKTKVQVGLEGRANPVYELARTFYRSDSVRTPMSLLAHSHEKTSWRVPAPDPSQEKARNWRLDPALSLGLPGEWGTHQFDVFHMYMEQFPKSVRGGGAVRLYKDGREIPDTVWAVLDYGDGLNCIFEATLGNTFGRRYEVFHGQNGAIKLAWTHGWLFKEADAPTLGWEVYANRQQFHKDEGITLIAGATKLAEQGKLKEGIGLPHEPVWYALESFLKSVAEDAPVVATAEYGLAATVVGIRTHEAVRSGKEVEIAETDLTI